MSAFTKDLIDEFKKKYPDTADLDYYTLEQKPRIKSVKAFETRLKSTQPSEKADISDIEMEVTKLLDIDYNCFSNIFQVKKLSNLILGRCSSNPLDKLIELIRELEQIPDNPSFEEEANYKIIYEYRQNPEYPDTFDINSFDYTLTIFEKKMYIPKLLIDYLNTITRKDDERYKTLLKAYNHTINSIQDLFENINKFNDINGGNINRILSEFDNNILLYSGVSPNVISNEMITTLKHRPLFIALKSFTLDLRVAIHFSYDRMFDIANTDLMELYDQYNIPIPIPTTNIPKLKIIFIEKYNGNSGFAYISPSSSWEAEVLKGPSNYRYVEHFHKDRGTYIILFIIVEIIPDRVYVYNKAEYIAHVKTLFQLIKDQPTIEGGNNKTHKYKYKSNCKSRKHK